MRTTILKLQFLIFALTISFISNAQQVWTLEQCINYALQNNIQLKQQKLNAEYNKNIYSQSKTERLPNLNAFADQNLSFGRSVDPYTNEFSDDNVKSNNFGISSSVTIFKGLQNYYTIKQNHFNLLASLSDVDKIKNDISLNIVSTYLQILFNKELVKIAENQLAITKQQTERTKKLIDAGSLAKGSLFEMQAQESSEELSVINAKNQLDISLLVLTQLLEFDSVGSFNINVPDFPELEEIKTLYSVEQIYSEAINTLPQIKSSEYKLKSAEKGLLVARGTMYPTLSFRANYGTGYSNARYKYIDGIPETTIIGQTETSGESVIADYPTYIQQDYSFGNQFKDNASTSLSFNLNIPIFNRFQTKTNTNNAHINVLNQKHNLQLSKNQLYKDIQQAYADSQASLRKHIASKKSVTSNEESFRYTQQKFDVGLVNSVDYNIAKNNLTKAKSELLQAKYEYIFKTKILDFYKGIPIKL
ncbi:MAG: TolC family protein [Bacteroidales bacterium]|nr:TolC family protein [Bacteroidales bacterium]